MDHRSYSSLPPPVLLLLPVAARGGETNLSGQVKTRTHRVTRDDPWVTQDDPRVTEDDLRVTQDDSG